MKYSNIFASLVLITSVSAGFIKRQTNGTDTTTSCYYNCALQEQTFPTNCDRNSDYCLCQDQGFLQAFQNCLTAGCNSTDLALANEVIQRGCASVIAAGPSASSSSRSASATATTSRASSTGSASSSLTTLISATSSVPTTAPVSSVPPVSSSSSAATTSPAAASTTSRAWAAPTAAAGYMGALLAAAGAVAAL